MSLQDTIHETALKQAGDLQDKAIKTFQELRYMTWVTFAFGLILLARSGLLSTLQPGKTVEALGLGALGVTDLIALFLYKPMDRLQKANSDLNQQAITLKSWALSVNLELLAMRVSEPDTVKTASKNIQSAGTESAKAIQEYIKETVEKKGCS